MSYDVYWVKNRAEKIADFEHPTLRGVPLVTFDTPSFFSSHYGKAKNAMRTSLRLLRKGLTK